MAAPTDFPDRIPDNDPLLNSAYRHHYGGSDYHLIFPDWPQGYRRDAKAAVYLEDREKGEHRRVRNETLCEAVRRDYWRKIDYDNAHPMTDGAGPGFRSEFMMPLIIPNSLAGLEAQQQNRASGMVDGSYMTPRPPEAAPAPDPWTCPKCGAAGDGGKFCAGCGTRRPD